MKDVNKYGKFTVGSWTTPNSRRVSASLAVMALGLGGEAGEVQEHIKKFFRDGTFDEKRFKKELGDVVFYWARICRYFGYAPSRILAANVKKLQGRKKRGTVHGSGDDR